MILRTIVLSATFLSGFTTTLAGELPHIKFLNGSGQLIMNRQPFPMLGGELDISSAGTAAQTDQIIPKLAAMHVNTHPDIDAGTTDLEGV